MRITADTNVLVRVLVEDDAVQARTAQTLLARATVIAVPIAVFCELVWVLRRGYGRSADDVARALTAVIEIDTLITDRAAVAAGLAMLRAGGDFADGVIAHGGKALGAETFASFDRQAVERLRTAGAAAAADPSELTR